MSSRTLIEASAPSNIALIKYMGKTASATNLPANSSLSFTLEHLRTFVTLHEATEDGWIPLRGHPPVQLSQKGQQKFLNHFRRLKTAWGIPQNYQIGSANNFPSDCGLASSASSFAALTLAAARLSDQPLSLEQLSAISRLGSGSSCRSFFSPWALWRGEAAEPLSGLPAHLEHAVILIEQGHKAVSSSEAHLRVTTSARFAGRPERAEARLCDLLTALRSGDWLRSKEICWQEFEDMHELFETASPAFSYRTPRTHAALKQLRQIWQDEGDGPLVTMDAGPNIHLLWRSEQSPQAPTWWQGFDVLRSGAI